MVCELDLRRWALSLPGASEADHHGFPSFRVAGRVFCTLRADLQRLMVKLDGEDQHNVIAAHGTAISRVPGYWGLKGSTFVRYDLIDEALARTLLQLAWAHAAPKSLVKKYS